MKKVVISICAVAVVAITAINLNLVQNDLSSVNLSLANIMALARGEDGSGSCSTDVTQNLVGCELQTFYECVLGSDPECVIGYDICYGLCPGGNQFCPYIFITRAKCS